MKTQVLCQNCVHSYAYFDDMGDLLDDGCKLKRSAYSALKPTICSKYRDN